jgi:hypothetical protein
MLPSWQIGAAMTRIAATPLCLTPIIAMTSESAKSPFVGRIETKAGPSADDSTGAETNRHGAHTKMRQFV